MKTGWFLRGIAEGDTEFLSSNSSIFIEVGRIYVFNWYPPLVPCPAEPGSDSVVL